jgi:hypothetical protein
MQKVFIVLGMTVLVFFALTNITLAAAAAFSFGGKVIATTVADVNCTGDGTLVVLSSNATAAANAALNYYFESKSKANKTQKTVSEVSDVISGIYGSIPFYATDSSKKPKVGGLILGNANIAPNFKECKLQVGPYKIPFPVRDTTKNYNVSK